MAQQPKVYWDGDYSPPSYDSANISRYASGKIHDPVSHAVSVWLQVIESELMKGLLSYPCTRLLLPRYPSIVGPAVVGALRVVKSTNLNSFRPFCTALLPILPMIVLPSW
jgi:hypothetical protein